MTRTLLRWPLEDGAGEPRQTIRRARIAIHSSILLMFLAPSHAADVSVFGAPWPATFGSAQLLAGAGTDFDDPVASDVLIAVLSISNTGGGPWNLKVALDGGLPQLPPGLAISLKRGGGSGEVGLSDGLAYRALTNDLQTFFSGAGDYDSVEILLRLDGLTVQVPPGLLSLGIRYAIEAP